MVIGFILGIVNGTKDAMLYNEYVIGGMEYDQSYQSFHFGTFFITALGSFLLGMLFIGLSEIIKLLHRAQNIESSIDTLENKVHKELIQGTSTTRLTKLDKEKIDNLFPELKKEIYSTPFDSLFVVVLQHDVADIIKVIDVGGFKAEEVQTKETVDKVMDWYQKHLNK